jgi:putative PIN family toxin of toxin-antitoxin system
MIRVVADTNIFVSAIMFGGLPGAFLDLALRGSFSLVISDALLNELDEKLRLKFRVSADDSGAMRAKLEGIADVVTPAAKLAAIFEDPDDDRVLECAIEGRADCIVSGDRHLLKLVSYRSIPILTVRQFFSFGQPEQKS